MTNRNELERLLAAATEGPWEWGKNRTWLFRDNLKADGNFSSTTIISVQDAAFAPNEDDAALICFLRNNAHHYLSLMDEVERLRGAMREYFAAKDACSDYINRRTQTPSIVRLAKLKDAEEVARQALGETHDN